MKKINLDSLNRINGRRLHLDTKQKKLTQHLSPKKEKTRSYLNSKSQHHLPPRPKIIKKFPIKDEYPSILPYLMRESNENPKSTNNLANICSHSEGRKRSTYKKIANQNFRFQVSSKKIKIQRKKTLLLQVEDQKQIFQNVTLQRIQCGQNIHILLVEKQKMKSQNSLSHNIFEQKPGSIQLISNKAEMKEFLNIEVQTDLQISSQSYKEFMRFKIAQKQKYSKMEDIFKFIDEISHNQTPIIKQRYQKIKMWYDEPLNGVRQKRVSSLMEEVKKGEAAFSQFAASLVKDLITIENTTYLQNLSEINSTKEQLSKFKKNYQKSFKLNQNNQPNVNNVDPLTFYNPNKHVQQQEKSPNKKKKKVNSSQNDLITKRLLNRFIEMEHRVVKIHEQMQTKSFEIKNQLQKRLQSWQLALDQKDYAIHICVQDVMRLPEIILSIFGMNTSNDQAKESDILKKIGVFLQDVPSFDSFFSKASKKSQDLVFKQLLEYKCLNCAYLKSKMRYVYTKNRELQQVIKILNHLVRKQKKNFF